MMGSSNYEVFDISSDEEEEEEAEEGEEEDCGGKKPGENWLEGLLDNDSDDIMIVGEVEGHNGNSGNSVVKSIENDDDDECVILDGDPDKPVEVENGGGTGNDETDELMVTGEKGQIACRDYPHPRHLCARFPFTSNPHEKYCDLCHCYVCDTKAPCIYWGTGVSTADHCHSSDKEEVWKMQRKCFKQGKAAPPMTTCHPPGGPPVHKSIRAPSLPQPMSNGSTQRFMARSNTLRPCSSQRIYHPAGVTAGRNSVAHTGFSTTTPLSGSNMRSNGRFVSPHVNFKKVNRSGPGTCNKNYAYTHASVQSLSNNPKGVTYSGIQNTRPQEHLVGNNSEVNACQRSSQAAVGGVSFIDSQSHNILQTQAYNQHMPQPQVYSQHVPQPQVYRQPVPQPQAYNQPMPLPQPQPLPLPLPLPPAYRQPVPQGQAYCHPVLQPQAYSQPVCQPSQNHVNTYPSNQPSNMVHQNLPVLEPHLLNNTVQSLAPSENCHFSNVQTTSGLLPVTQPSNQESETLSCVTTQLSGVQSAVAIPSSTTQTTSGLTIQLSSVKPSSEALPVTESLPQSIGTTELGPNDFDFDSWIHSLEQQDFITGNGNLQSEPGLITSSMLMFDFENS